MKEQLVKQDMVVGKEYKGYAWLNEYMEIFFRPAAVGSRAGRIKKIVEKENYTVSGSKKYVFIHIRIPKASDGAMGYIRFLGNIYTELIKVFTKYEI